MSQVGATHQIPVAADPEAGWDYTDVFEVTTSTNDTRSAEEWARAALDEALAPLRPVVLFIHRRVLGFRLGPSDSPDHILGWTIETRDESTIRLGADGDRMRGVIVGHRSAPDRLELRSTLFFKQQSAAPVWFVVGPIHRAVARWLLRATARSAPR